MKPELLVAFYAAYGHYVKTQRRGQALMNALDAVDRETFLLLENTEADCFYDDRRIPAFRLAVGLSSETQTLGLPTTSKEDN